MKPVTSKQRFHSNGESISDPLEADADAKNKKHYDKEKYLQ